MHKGKLIILSGPSGCGKGTMVAEILKHDAFALSVSATTRSPRPGEIDGVHYHFLTKKAFEQRIAAGEMLEYAQYCGNYYGTPLDTIEAMRMQGKHVILEIEVQGALQVMEKCPDAISVFTIPPSLSELRRRLEKRGTESSDIVEQRMNRAAEELALAKHYQYIVINDALETAVEDFCAIIRAESQTYEAMQERIGEMLSC